MYNGKASVGQEELKEFLTTGKELQVKGLEAYVSGVEESVRDNLEINTNENEDTFENEDNITGNDEIYDTLDMSTEKHFVVDGNLIKKEENIEMNTMSELNVQIREMIEKSDGVWKCKICGKTSPYHRDMRRHAETHIEGTSHACHICNKSYPNRHGLRCHIDAIHSELLSCDLCGKSGMNKRSLRHHKASHHKTLSGPQS